jgi:hypothetical protein
VETLEHEVAEALTLRILVCECHMCLRLVYVGESDEMFEVLLETNLIQLGLLLLQHETWSIGGSYPLSLVHLHQVLLILVLPLFKYLLQELVLHVGVLQFGGLHSLGVRVIYIPPHTRLRIGLSSHIGFPLLRLTQILDYAFQVLRYILIRLCHSPIHQIR